MQVSITVRHTTVPDEIKERARELVEKLAARAHRPHHAAVIFDAEHNRSIVELKLKLPKAQVLVATAEADDHRTALDRVVEKINSQLDRAAPAPVRR